MFAFMFLSCCLGLSFGETYLEADGVTDTYALINRVFGEGRSSVEVPDCNHTTFGPHITQLFDTTLNDYAFAFNLHIRNDDDRCVKFDRQRVEIKTNDNLQGADLTGHEDESMTLSWNFKLDSDFLPPYSFCHVFQLKAVDGDDSLPLITLTPRKSTPNELQLLQYNSKQELFFLKSVDLQGFLGEWIHANVTVTYGFLGSFGITLTRLSDNQELLTFENFGMDLWRNETTFIRPKWGIYRSVQEAALSRDETVLFHNFCVGKGTNDVCV